MPEEAKDAPKYEAVDLTMLKAGMLVDRPLYVYLASNDRYIPLCKALHPLEEHTLSKMRKLGNVFSSEPSIETRFPQLAEAARVTRALCDNEALAPFERNRAVRATTEWLIPHVLQGAGHTVAPLIFFHRAFEIPKAETLVFISDLSVEMYEHSLALASLSGVLALWLGFSNTRFLGQFAETVFCEAVGFYREITTTVDGPKISDAQRGLAAELLRTGQVPGVSVTDFRFQSYLSQRAAALAAGDELEGIVEFARWLLKLPGSDDARMQAGHNRVARKLGWQLSNSSVPAASDAAKAAA